MTNNANLTKLVKAHKSVPAGMIFYDSINSVLSDAGIIGYVSAIKRAWNELKLDGILCLDRRPVLYLKKYGRPSSSTERIRLQRLFWNQGIANVLVIADPISVYIYSGLAMPPRNESDEEAIESALIEEVTLVDYIQQIQSLYHSLATGHYYDVHKNHFKPEQAVDLRLLKHLRGLRNSLIKGEGRLDAPKAHAFIGRILFLCYLLDRGIISVKKTAPGQTGTMALAEILSKQISHKERINYLYDELFHYLKERFNGNMFDQKLDAEKRHIRRLHLEKLILFLDGHEVESGQQEFGFWPYDFKMIPVETISAIYQDFLSIEDREAQQKRGAFYTPRFLAEMVVDIAIRDNDDAFNWSFLDPACGSGIFLVILFNRLANRWILNQPGAHYVEKANALKAILAHQICGIDVEETACRIACFSLYLAYLDFFTPPDIQSHIKKTGERLPKLLDYGNESVGSPADIPVIHLADFLDDKTLAGNTFDCVIGNPPWEGRQSKQLAQKFMEKAPRFMKSNGTGCLLLPSKILQNQTDVFQSEWLRNVTLEKVFQLADYSFLLFQDALCPAMITFFVNKPSNITQHNIEFIAPKFNRDGLRQGIIAVNPSSRTCIPLSDILVATQTKTAPVVWKRHLWGTHRDQKLLDYMLSLPKLSDIAGKPSEGKRWVKGIGFQPYYPQKAKDNIKYPKPRQNPWELKTSYVPASKNLNMILLSSDCMPLENRLKGIGASTKYLRRAPHKALFKAPLVLVSKGFGNVAYCSFNVLFEDALRSISGPRKDHTLLIFLSAYLQSKLAWYFLFHTSANWGSERDQVHLSELLRIPFPLPDNNSVSPDGQKIIEQVSRKFDGLHGDLHDSLKKLRLSIKRQSLFVKDEAEIIRHWQQERRKLADALQTEIEPLIYRYFGLTEHEVMLVEDTIHVFEPSSTPTTWLSPQTVTLDDVNETTVKPYKGIGLKLYADTLTTTLNKWAQAEGSTYRICAEGGTDEKTGLIMITLSTVHTETEYKQKNLSGHLAKKLNELYRHVSRKQGALLYQRDIFLFKGNRIHIVRPNILLNWTRTSALNDAARIYGEIALTQKVDHGK